MMEVNLEMCDGSKDVKRRKGDIYTDFLKGLTSKFGNRSIDCPLKKVGCLIFE